jgi:hypothetical protein
MKIWRSKEAAECHFCSEVEFEFRGRRRERQCGNDWSEGVRAKERLSDGSMIRRSANNYRDDWN